ncbi:MAG: ABC transporter permease, partial [Bacteroidota bacterium]|nr:ABC transporter permease [Bacteroidota bacterium]
MWNLFIKDIKLFISDKKAMMLSFLLPIILITLFALAFGGLGSGNHKSTPTRILLTDLDNSETSREVISTLDSIKGLKFEQTSIDTLKQFIIKGHRLAGLVFYKGCEDSINQGHQKPMELFYDKSRNMEIGLVQQALIGKLMEITGSKGIKTRILSQIQNDYADLNTTTLIDIQKRVNESFNKEDNSSSFSGGLDITPIQVKKGINWGLIQAVAGTS